MFVVLDDPKLLRSDMLREGRRVPAFHLYRTVGYSIGRRVGTYRDREQIAGPYLYFCETLALIPSFVQSKTKTCSLIFKSCWENVFLRRVLPSGM